MMERKKEKGKTTMKNHEEHCEWNGTSQITKGMEDEVLWCKIWQLFYDSRTLLSSPNLPRPLLFREPTLANMKRNQTSIG